MSKSNKPIEAPKEIIPEQPPAAIPATDNSDKILRAVGNMAGAMEKIMDRLDTLEGKGKPAFKESPKAADVEKAAKAKAELNPRVVQIVEEVLGEDFGIEMEPNKDNPGFLFTVIVPERLSDLKKQQRPVYDSVMGGYEKDLRTGEVVTELYFPEDRRSRAIASTASFDAIREHCERIRGYIVGYYQRAKQPLPDFKTKS